MYQVSIYIQNQRINLFKDESINVISSVQNIQDISKVFTDFSQSFTVPADKVNNAIFSYWYNNDLNEFNANLRVEARIEVNLVPFRKGKIQLESAKIENGQVKDYEITFFGDVVTLKDLFGDLKLKDLDYSNLEFEYNGDNVASSITNTSYQAVRFPLISSSRVWSYGDATSTDISLSGNAINYAELYPAISDATILGLIEDTFGVTFEGLFLANDRLKKSYTWWKNTVDSNFGGATQSIPLTFNPLGLDCDSEITSGIATNKVIMQFEDVNTFSQPAGFSSWSNFGQFHRCNINVTVTSGGGTYYLDVYNNGVLSATYTGSGSQNFIPVTNLIQENNIFGLDNEYTFKIRTTATMGFDIDVNYEFRSIYQNTSNVPVQYVKNCSFSSTGFSSTAFVDFALSAPDQTINEWFNGVLNQFNLTCYPTDSNLTYQVEPLQEWYGNGKEVDITKHTTDDEIKVDRLELYKEIIFKYAESKSFMNAQFKTFFGRDYGSLQKVFGFDGKSYKVELPFETLLFNKFTGENLQVAYALETEPDYKPYLPKPVKLYLYDDQSCDFYLEKESTTVNITNYLAFGQDINYNTEVHTINFGEEISSLTLNPEHNSLYTDYYQNYLVSLFSPKSRKLTVKCQLPISLIYDIKLNDRIILRDKKYIIDSIKTDITTGMATLVLMSDLSRTAKKPQPPVIGSVGGTIVFPLPAYTELYNVIETPVFITTVPTLPTTLATATDLVITVPANTTGSDRTNTIPYTVFDAFGNSLYSDTIVIFQSGSDSYLLKEDGGYLLQEDGSVIIL